LITCWFIFCHLPIKFSAGASAVIALINVTVVGLHGRLRILEKEFSSKSSGKSEIREGSVMALVVKCQLLVTETSVQSHSCLFRALGVSGGTEARFA
jgi:hypothetical protein